MKPAEDRKSETVDPIEAATAAPVSGLPTPTVEELAVRCIAGAATECDETGNMPPEEHPRWCNRCPAGRERREWLKIDGVKVFDPHLEDAPA